MERGSAKHSGRVDDAMAEEARGILQGGVGGIGGVGGTPSGGAPPGMTPEEVEGRSRLGRYIPMSSLPGDRERLIVGAHDLNAPDDILADLARLPAGETFRTVNQIWAALGHHNEDHRT